MEKNLRKIVAEELAKVISEDNYDYAAEERGFHDQQGYEAFEAFDSDNITPERVGRYCGGYVENAYMEWIMRFVK